MNFHISNALQVSTGIGTHATLKVTDTNGYATLYALQRRWTDGTLDLTALYLMADESPARRKAGVVLFKLSN